MGYCLRKNVWLLTSIATQADADRNVPELLKCRDLVPVLGLSAEPLVGPVDLRFEQEQTEETEKRKNSVLSVASCSIDWVIVGGESGAQARPMHPDWARSIRDQCQAAGVPFFFKQWGEWSPWLGRTLCELRLDRPDLQTVVMPDGRLSELCEPDGAPMARLGKKNAGRLLDGREWNEYPNAMELAK